MRPMRREYVVALLIFLAGLTGAAMILTIPPYFASDDGSRAWVTAALGCAFLVLVGVGARMRRKHLSDSPKQQPPSGL